jgi:hypothetical protein
MEPYLDWKEITITPAQLTGYTTAIPILDTPAANDFYEVVKIMVKVQFNSVAYDYIGNIDFEINAERIMRFQADIISTASDTVSIGNAMLCQDTCAPFLGLGYGLELTLDSAAPTVGDSDVYIKVWYYKHEF